MSTATPLRIAHGYGNHWDLLDKALVGPVDYVEADVWYRGGQLWVRHERRLGSLPLLYDNHSRPRTLIGPGSFSIGPWYIRPDLKPIGLPELLERVRGKRGLLLDLKGRYRRIDETAFVETLARLLAQHSLEGEAYLCGQNWSLLDKLRSLSPQLRVCYSIERPFQWQAFSPRLAAGPRVDGLCLHRTLIDAERTHQLRGIEVFSWTVNDPQEARRLLALGVTGIISDDLALLGSLQAPASPSQRTEG